MEKEDTELKIVKLFFKEQKRKRFQLLIHSKIFSKEALMNCPVTFLYELTLKNLDLNESELSLSTFRAGICNLRKKLKNQKKYE